MFNHSIRHPIDLQIRSFIHRIFNDKMIFRNLFYYYNLSEFRRCIPSPEDVKFDLLRQRIRKSIFNLVSMSIITLDEIHRMDHQASAAD